MNPPEMQQAHRGMPTTGNIPNGNSQPQTTRRQTSTLNEQGPIRRIFTAKRDHIVSDSRARPRSRLNFDFVVSESLAANYPTVTCNREQSRPEKSGNMLGSQPSTESSAMQSQQPLSLNQEKFEAGQIVPPYTNAFNEGEKEGIISHQRQFDQQQRQLDQQRKVQQENELKRQQLASNPNNYFGGNSPQFQMAPSMNLHPPFATSQPTTGNISPSSILFGDNGGINCEFKKPSLPVYNSSIAPNKPNVFSSPAPEATQKGRTRDHFFLEEPLSFKKRKIEQFSTTPPSLGSSMNNPIMPNQNNQTPQSFPFPAGWPVSEQQPPSSQGSCFSSKTSVTTNTQSQLSLNSSAQTVNMNLPLPIANCTPAFRNIMGLDQQNQLQPQPSPFQTQSVQATTQNRPGLFSMSPSQIMQSYAAPQSISPPSVPAVDKNPFSQQAVEALLHSQQPPAVQMQQPQQYHQNLCQQQQSSQFFSLLQPEQCCQSSTVMEAEQTSFRIELPLEAVQQQDPSTYQCNYAQQCPQQSQFFSQECIQIWQQQQRLEQQRLQQLQQQQQMEQLQLQQYLAHQQQLQQQQLQQQIYQSYVLQQQQQQNCFNNGSHPTLIPSQQQPCQSNYYPAVQQPLQTVTHEQNQQPAQLPPVPHQAPQATPSSSNTCQRPYGIEPNKQGRALQANQSIGVSSQMSKAEKLPLKDLVRIQPSTPKKYQETRQNSIQKVSPPRQQPGSKSSVKIVSEVIKYSNMQATQIFRQQPDSEPEKFGKKSTGSTEEFSPSEEVLTPSYQPSKYRSIKHNHPMFAPQGTDLTAVRQNYQGVLPKECVVRQSQQYVTVCSSSSQTRKPSEKASGTQTTKNPDIKMLLKHNPRAPKCCRYETVPDIALLDHFPNENLLKLSNLQVIHGNITVIFRAPVNLLDVDLDQAVTFGQNSFSFDKRLIKTARHSVLVTFRNFNNFKDHVKTGELESYYKFLNLFLVDKSFKGFDEATGTLRIRI